MKYLDSIVEYLHQHDVHIVKDILVPAFSPDKIIALIGLIYVVRSFIKTNRITRINFICQLTQYHRDVWSKIEDLDLKEKLKNASLNYSTLSEKEKKSIIYLILHIKISYEASKDKILRIDDGILKDIGTIMNYPLVGSAWEEIKPFHEKGFVSFVEKARSKTKQPPKRQFLKSVIGIVSKQGSRLIDYCKNFYIRKKRRTSKKVSIKK